LQAFRDKSGDCTEFMRLFVAYCRINNIPARGVSGYVANRDKVLAANEFHNWAEVFTGGAWRIVDPFNKVYMENEDDYVATRIHDGQADASPRWRTNDDNLRVTMER
jgi:transglutaminase-like putative cysteine protease